MKKVLPVLLSALLLMGALAACSSGDSSSSEQSSSSSSSSQSVSEAESSESESTSSAESESTSSREAQDPALLAEFVGVWELEGGGSSFELFEDGTATLYDSDGSVLDEEGYYTVDGSTAEITFWEQTETGTLDGDAITIGSNIYNRKLSA